MKEKKNKYYITWAEIDKFVDNLNIDIKYDYIISIHRGGNVLGTMLSHKLNIPLLIYTPTKSFNIDIQNKNILLVDDISDTGKTILKCIKDIQLEHVDVLTYAIKLHTNYTPEYYKITMPNDIWVVYPWEKEQAHE